MVVSVYVPMLGGGQRGLERGVSVFDGVSVGVGLWDGGVEDSVLMPVRGMGVSFEGCLVVDTTCLGEGR
jgi:hypothetical protein